jgi:20S proteasome alpha/beta subunit
MTICIAVKVHDCMVFVTDSASSSLGTDANGNTGVSRVYNNGHKLFNLARGYPVFAMTCGVGNFGNSSISTIAKGIRHDIECGETDVKLDDLSIEQVAKYCHSIFQPLYDEMPPEFKQAASFSLFVGGYSSGANGSELWKIQFSGDNTPEPSLIAAEDDCSIFWDGQPEACTRLVSGISPHTQSVLMSVGLKPEDAIAVTDRIRASSVADILYAAMPVQDAVDLGQFLAETTSSFVKFLPGANTVGGDLDIATVTKYEGFKWIKRKHYYPRSLNRETDHDKKDK